MALPSAMPTGMCSRRHGAADSWSDHLGIGGGEVHADVDHGDEVPRLERRRRTGIGGPFRHLFGDGSGDGFGDGLGRGIAHRLGRTRLGHRPAHGAHRACRNWTESASPTAAKKDSVAEPP